MNAFTKIRLPFTPTLAFILALTVVSLTVSDSPVFGHGGEDHGDQKPATTTTQNGTVARTVRVGDFELLLKHSVLAPDAAASARLFLTHFETNEPIGSADISAEIESGTGTVTPVTVNKTEAPGSYVVNLPALPEGGYTFRATVTGNGKTHTATLSGIDVGAIEPAHPSSGGSSWAQTALTAFLFLFGSLLFGGLIYLAFRVIRNKPTREEAVAA